MVVLRIFALPRRGKRFTTGTKGRRTYLLFRMWRPRIVSAIEIPRYARDFKKRLIRLNDSSKIPRSRHDLFFLWLAYADFQRISNHIDIFEAGAGIVKHNLVCRLEETLLQQHLIYGQACGAFRSCEYAFFAGPLLKSGKDLFVGDGHRHAATLL